MELSRMKLKEGRGQRSDKRKEKELFLEVRRLSRVVRPRFLATVPGWSWGKRRRDEEKRKRMLLGSGVSREEP